MFSRYLEINDFLTLPYSNNFYFLNINNVLKDINGLEILPYLDSNGRTVVKINWFDGFKEYDLAYITAIVFKPINLPLLFWGKLKVLFKDGNKQNLHPVNLVWKYPIALGEKEFYGFSFIPGFSRYLINRKGDVYDLKRNKQCNKYYNKGYYSYSLLPDIGHRATLKRHRALALTYLDYPINVDQLEVNHIDGIPGNDIVNNLEWCTASYNRTHAINNNLTPSNKPVLVCNTLTNEVTEYNTLDSFCKCFNLSEQLVSKSLSSNEKVFRFNNFEASYKFEKHKTTEKTNITAVLVRNLRTGEVQEFSSISLCSDILNISKHIINGRINTPTNHLYSDCLQFKRKSDNTPWYEPKDLEQELLESIWVQATLIKILSTNEIKEFETQRLAAKYLGIAESTVFQWVNSKNQPVFKNRITGDFILIKNKSNKNNWRDVKNPIEEYEKSALTKAILVKNSETGEIKEFSSAVECSKFYKMLPTTLNWRLKSNGQKIYPDKLLFKYKYSDNTFI